jgi:hypothetical protein
MPVQTRSQRKNINAEELKRVHFNYAIKKIVALCSAAEGIENKMRVSLELYEYLNKNLPEFVEKYKSEAWIVFTATVFNKTTEMVDDEKQGNWFYIDKALVKKFNIELHKCRNMAMSLIKNYPVWSSNVSVKTSKEEIARVENSRPRRSVLRVDYKCMDIMEPEF